MPIMLASGLLVGKGQLMLLMFAYVVRSPIVGHAGRCLTGQVCRPSAVPGRAGWAKRMSAVAARARLEGSFY